MAAQYKLTYFNGRGAAEIMRLLFAVSDTKFDDVRLDRETWGKKKDDMPMKQLPVIEVTINGKTTMYCQSGAISKYLAKKFGLAGNDDEEALKVNEFLDSLDDVMRAVIKAAFGPEDKKEEAMAEIKKTTIPTFSRYFKDRQSKFGSNGFIVGDQLTIADLAIFNFVNQTKLRFDVDFWTETPEIIAHAKKIESIPKVAEWLKKRPESEF